MQIGIGGSAATLTGIVDEAAAAERAGLATYSTSNIFAHDAIGALSVAATRTARIELLTAVVPAFPRHPLSLAQQALTAQASARGRFTLGIGASHRPVIERVLGLSYERPATRMREYLHVLLPLLRGEPVQFGGDVYRVKGALAVRDASPVSCVLAALGPVMLRMAGDLADGTVLWLTGARAIGEYVAPRICRAATTAGRPAPRIICGLPIALTRRPDDARVMANATWGVYARLPAYRLILDKQRAVTPGDVVLAGDESTLDGALNELRDAGVTTFLGTPLDAGDGSVDRTWEYLAARAGG